MLCVRTMIEADSQRPIRIAMWSGPRNISTAMMRAWENRNDTFVWDEPLYAYYLQRSGLDHPAAAEIIAAGQTDWRAVVERCIGAVPDGKSVFFQKHMTHHVLKEMSRDWLAQLTNCFLIRDPREVIASYARVRAHVTLDDIGVTQQADLFDDVCRSSAQQPVVVDARDILERPEAIMPALCEALGVSFSPRMMQWPAGLRDSDGVWAPHWYASVERSTGFAPFVHKSHRLPAELAPLAEQCMDAYQRLREIRLRA
jgi:hypothetical protein